MSPKASFLLILACLAGCASAGAPSQTLAMVPVYDSPEDVPCQYEPMGSVEGDRPASTVGSRAAYERERAQVLGRLAARLGADAVLVTPAGEPAGQRRPVGNLVVAVSDGGTPVIETPRNVRFEGEALRFIPGTCRDSR